jgi:hypothetical protein
VILAASGEPGQSSSPLNPVGEFTLLRRRQFARRATAMRAVEQPHNTLGVVAVTLWPGP